MNKSGYPLSHHFARNQVSVRNCRDQKWTTTYMQLKEDHLAIGVPKSRKVTKA